MKTSVVSWYGTLTQAFDGVIKQLVAFIPQLISAAIVLIIGWLLAYILRISTRNLINGFDSFFQRLIKANGVQRERIQRSYAALISNVIFWAVMIVSIAIAGNLLGWRLFANWMDSIINYLPNVISGAFIVLTGFFLSVMAKASIISAAHSAQAKQGPFLARVVQATILFIAIVIGVEQIGIDVGFLTDALIVIIGVLLAGGALAFALGAKTLIANIIGAQYLRKHCRVGEVVRINNSEGCLVEITQTSMVLDTEHGRILIPAKYFQEQAVCLLSDGNDGKQESKREKQDNLS